MSDIITESRNENTKDIDILSTIEMVKKMNEEDKLVALAVEEELENIAAAVDLIAKQFLKGATFQLHNRALYQIYITQSSNPFYTAAAFALILSITFLIPIHTFKSVKISTTLP